MTEEIIEFDVEHEDTGQDMGIVWFHSNGEPAHEFVGKLNHLTDVLKGENNLDVVFLAINLIRFVLDDEDAGVNKLLVLSLLEGVLQDEDPDGTLRELMHSAPEETLQ